MFHSKVAPGWFRSASGSYRDQPACSRYTPVRSNVGEIALAPGEERGSGERGVRKKRRFHVRG